MRMTAGWPSNGAPITFLGRSCRRGHGRPPIGLTVQGRAGNACPAERGAEGRRIGKSLT